MGRAAVGVPELLFGSTAGTLVHVSPSMDGAVVMCGPPCFLYSIPELPLSLLTWSATSFFPSHCTSGVSCRKPALPFQGPHYPPSVYRPLCLLSLQPLKAGCSALGLKA